MIVFWCLLKFSSVQLLVSAWGPWGYCCIFRSGTKVLNRWWDCNATALNLFLHRLVHHSSQHMMRLLPVMLSVARCLFANLKDHVDVKRMLAQHIIWIFNTAGRLHHTDIERGLECFSLLARNCEDAQLADTCVEAFTEACHKHSHREPIEETFGDLGLHWPQDPETYANQGCLTMWQLRITILYLWVDAAAFRFCSSKQFRSMFPLQQSMATSRSRRKMCQDKLPASATLSEGPKKSAGRLKHGYLVVHGMLPVSTFPLEFPFSAQAFPFKKQKTWWGCLHPCCQHWEDEPQIFGSSCILRWALSTSYIGLESCARNFKDS